MRQLFTWRFVAVIAALAGLALLVNVVVVDDDQLTAVLEPEPLPRKIDLISAVLFVEASDDFSIAENGLTTGVIDFVLDEQRVMRVSSGTPGEIRCDDISLVSKCAVFADLLGEAVIWFTVLPATDRGTVELPPIIDLQDNYALFDNGWQISYPPVIERLCDGEDIVSFSDFLRRFGRGSTTVVDLEQQQVVQVRCRGTDAPVITPPVTEFPIEAPLDGPPSSILEE